MMADTYHETPQRWVDLLPAIYQDAGDGKSHLYLRDLLRPFEQIFWGLPDEGETAKKATEPMALRDEIARLHELSDPWHADDRFLPWLAEWTALTLRVGMRTERKRELIANMLRLYCIRGTKTYLEELLRLCVDVPVSIDESDLPPFQVGHSALGEDSYIGGGPPHFFRVRMVAQGLSVQQMEVQRQLAYQVVELAKPVHTGYAFETDSPQMQIDVHSTVGIDTVLGPAPAH
jgi:phage tail-like protein